MLESWGSSFFAFGGFVMSSQRPADKVSWLWMDTRTDVPVWISNGIGRIAVEWSKLEEHFEETIRLLMATDMHIGRIAITGMGLRSRTKLAVDLAQAHVFYGSLKTDAFDEIADIRTKITDRPGYEQERNKVVHGLWARVEGQWYLLRSTGARSIPEVVADLGKLARATLPQKEIMTREKLATILEIIVGLNARKLAFHERLEAELPPSPYKSRRQIQQSHPSHARRKKAPARPPPPFRLRRQSKKK